MSSRIEREPPPASGENPGSGVPGVREISKDPLTPEKLLGLVEAVMTGNPPVPTVPLEQHIQRLRNILRSKDLQKLLSYLAELDEELRIQTEEGGKISTAVSKLTEIANSGRTPLVDSRSPGNKITAIVLTGITVAASAGIFIALRKHRGPKK